MWFLYIIELVIRTMIQTSNGSISADTEVGCTDDDGSIPTHGQWSQSDGRAIDHSCQAVDWTSEVNHQ